MDSFYLCVRLPVSQKFRNAPVLSVGPVRRRPVPLKFYFATLRARRAVPLKRQRKPLAAASRGPNQGWFRRPYAGPNDVLEARLSRRAFWPNRTREQISVSHLQIPRPPARSLPYENDKMLTSEARSVRNWCRSREVEREM